MRAGSIAPPILISTDFPRLFSISTGNAAVRNRG